MLADMGRLINIEPNPRQPEAAADGSPEAALEGAASPPGGAAWLSVVVIREIKLTMRAAPGAGAAGETLTTELRVLAWREGGALTAVGRARGRVML